MTEHKKICLKRNAKKAVKLEKRRIAFKNLFKQILVPFKIYSDFKRILNSVKKYEWFCSKKYHITHSFAYKPVCLDDKVNQLFFTELKMLLINSLKQFLNSMNTVNK